MASKRRLRRRACTGKVGHATRELAEQAMKVLYRHGACWLNTYYCRFCGRYHVGHTPAHVRQAMAAKRGTI